MSFCNTTKSLSKSCHMPNGRHSDKMILHHLHHDTSKYFSTSQLLSYRKKSPQVDRKYAAPRYLPSPGSRPVDKRQQRISQNKFLRKDRDDKHTRQWRNDLFRRETIPRTNQSRPEMEEKTKMQISLEIHERDVTRKNALNDRLKEMNETAVWPTDIEPLTPLPLRKHTDLYPFIKTKRVTLPSQTFIDLLQDPFRKRDTLIQDDSPLRYMLQKCRKYNLKSRATRLFAAYHYYFRVSEETMIELLNLVQSKQDVWYIVNFLRHHEGSRYLESDIQTKRNILTPSVARIVLQEAHKKGSLEDMYSAFGLLYETPLVHRFEFMEYSGDEEYAIFNNDKRWKLVPTSADYALLVEHSLMKSDKPHYHVEQIIMSLQEDPQMTYEHAEHETKFIEYWIHGYIMGGELDQALDVYRYHVKSNITYDERAESAYIESTEKMEEPLREAFAMSGDEKTYQWFCSNVCPEALASEESMQSFFDEEMEDSEEPDVTADWEETNVAPARKLNSRARRRVRPSLAQIRKVRLMLKKQKTAAEEEQLALSSKKPARSYQMMKSIIMQDLTNEIDQKHASETETV